MSKEKKEQEVGCLSRGQGAVQAVIRPAMWFPGLRAIHQFQETWLLGDTDQEKGADTLAEGVRNMSHEEYIFQLKKVNHEKKYSFIEIHCYTRARWLDVVEITFRQSKTHKQTVAIARAFSTGIFPVSVPAAPLLNALFFWLPFSDNQFPEEVWLTEIKKASGLQIEVGEAGRRC